MLLQCPICGTRGMGRAAGGWFPEGQDSDLLMRVREAWHPIQVEIHTCKGCGLSGLMEDFSWMWPTPVGQLWTHPAKISDARREDFLSQIRPKYLRLKERYPDMPPHVGYELAYRSSQVMGLDDVRLVKMLLRAYWCLRLKPSSDMGHEKCKEKGESYLASMVRLFSRMTSKRSVQTNLLYVAGEMCRRAAKYEASEAYFRMFMARKDCAEYLRKAAARLIDKALEHNPGHLSMESLLYDPV